MSKKWKGGRKSRHKKRKSRRRKTRRRRRRKTRRRRRRKTRRRKRGGFLKRREFNVTYNDRLKKIEGSYPNSDTIGNLLQEAETAFDRDQFAPAVYGLRGLKQSLEWTPSLMEPLPPAINTSKKITEKFPEKNLILFILNDYTTAP